MAGSVYIETSVASAYVSHRTDASSIHRREATREWWREQLALYESWISEAVVAELERGRWPGQNEALELVMPRPRLPVDEEVTNVALRYVDERLVPKLVSGDATHLALASVHNVDFLLTWNIRHLANPNKLDHLTVINRRMGLLTPQIVTPEWLWLEDVE